MMKRRSFLARAMQGTAASLLRPGFAESAQAPDVVEVFASEKEHDRIAAVLAEFSKLGKAPWESAGQLIEAHSKLVRSRHGLEVREVTYANQQGSGKAWLAEFSEIITANYQITRVEILPDAIQTRVRYEIVGSGAGFHREQRIGTWNLEWNRKYQLRNWSAETETRARSTRPWYSDMSSEAFGRAASWREQLSHGQDYWRTILDGATGIDVYGHCGVSVGDIDGDGFDDIYICQPAGLPNRLYRNRGNGTFEDITEDSGVGLLDNTACALFADVDNDSNQDLIVVRATGPLLFLNQGSGKFRLKPDAFQFASPPQGTFTGAAVADYDRDGWLDIYFCLYTYYQGTEQYNYPVPYYAAENGPPNFLLRNNRDGTFRDVTEQTGLDKNNSRYSFCCAWGDFNNDGWPDLYVVNDFGRKNLYRNNGDGTFTDIAAKAGVEDVGAGMGVCWLDANNDGAEDLYVANMWTAAGQRIAAQEDFHHDSPARAAYQKHAMGNSLFVNRGNGGFQDASSASGTGIGRWAWSSDAWDFDHDGFSDLYIANGMISGPIREDLNSFFWRQVVTNSPDDTQRSPEYEKGWSTINDLIRSDHSWSGYERNVFYANNGTGTFCDVSGAMGLDFIEDSRAFALADFDHDGRLEVLLKNRNAPQVRLLKNVIDELPPSIVFQLRGVKSNRDAIGTVVILKTELGRQMRRVNAGSGFLSQHSKTLHFGLGTARGPLSASIHWPSGVVQELRELRANSQIWIEEGREPTRMEPFRKPAKLEASESPTTETLPDHLETWLLNPVPAPNATAGLLVIDQTTPEETRKVYNLLYRYLFDRRRDLSLPTSFLIDEHRDIVKVYQGVPDAKRVEADKRASPRNARERLARALPFPGNADTYAFGRNHLSLGSVFFQNSLFEQSEAFFKQALRDDPASAEALYGLGSIYLKQGKRADARARFEQATKLKANYVDTTPNAWNNLGLLDTQEGRLDSAIANFKEALRVSPDYWIALQNLGNAYRQQRRWDEARTVLERLLTVRPHDSESNYSLAMVFAQNNDAPHAEELLNKALQLRPQYPEALNNLGILYLRTRRVDQALSKFKECIQLAPDFEQAYLNLASVYNITNAPEQARAVLRNLLDRHPDSPAAKRALGELR